MEAVQQINLYRPALSLKHHRVPLGRLQIAASIALVALLAWPLWKGWTMWTLQRQVHQLTALLAEAKQQLATAEQQALLQDPELRGLNEADMRNELATLTSQHSVWSAFVPSEDIRYSRYLAAISRRQVAGLWLTRIELDGKNAGVRLEGLSTDPALVPAFVSRLGYEDVLAGVAFRGLHIFQPDEKDAPRPSHVGFVIATEPTASTRP